MTHPCKLTSRGFVLGIIPASASSDTENTGMLDTKVQRSYTSNTITRAESKWSGQSPSTQACFYGLHRRVS
ncbi:hypothetical protein BDV40DRAFT_70456 [Aspergillus tamarii]|uniref:Uncharacterized protein n=1 Tax=Aspergillus tamarii TaxID=41984 RepID=A0A5N6UDN0_ASPTM|nr:hypothetical protein BDV40DRAFT_70456 [Aspergillus tamarii]